MKLLIKSDVETFNKQRDSVQYFQNTNPFLGT